MKKNIIYSIVTIMLLAVFASAPALARETMTIAVHEYPPYYNAEGKGMLIDLYTAICDAAGMDAAFQVLPVKRAIEYLFQNKMDAFSPGHIFLSPEQVEQVSIVKTFTVLGIFLYHDAGHKKNLVFNSYADLKGHKLGVVVNSPLLPAYQEAGLTYEEIQHPESIVKMLRAGRIDFGEGTLLTGMTLINTLFNKEMKDFDFFINIPIECSVAFHKNNPEALARMEKFVKGFETVKQNGTYVRILESYWGTKNIQKQVLPPDLTQFGVEKASLEAFSKYKRDASGKIIP